MLWRPVDRGGWVVAKARFDAAHSDSGIGADSAFSHNLKGPEFPVLTLFTGAYVQGRENCYIEKLTPTQAGLCVFSRRLDDRIMKAFLLLHENQFASEHREDRLGD
jgi:hypothetical protein